MNERLRELDLAIASAPAGVRHWSDVARDPNDSRALAHRARTLRDAWRPPIPDRAQFVVDRTLGRRVLDVGCVAHDVDRMTSGDWLHRRIAEAASECVGVDILEEGVARMRALGFEAVVHDLSIGPGPLQHMPRFDVMVAGELIEHVPNLDMLFRAAHELLIPEGELILTTPNPYAPHRVWAGQRGVCWENTDHIVYAFPGGIAELAERNGFILVEAATTAPKGRRPRSVGGAVRSTKRLIKGSASLLAGITTQGPPAAVRIREQVWHRSGSSQGLRFTGETFIYVVRRLAERGHD